MALSASKVAVWKNGDRTEAVYDVTCDNSYPSGGYAISVSTFPGLPGTSSIQHVALSGLTSGGYATRWDKTNKKLMLFRTKDPGAAGGADIVLQECAGSVDVHSEVFHCRVLAK